MRTGSGRLRGAAQPEILFPLVGPGQRHHCLGTPSRVARPALVAPSLPGMVIECMPQLLDGAIRLNSKDSA